MDKIMRNLSVFLFSHRPDVTHGIDQEQNIINSISIGSFNNVIKRIDTFNVWLQLKILSNRST